MAARGTFGNHKLPKFLGNFFSLKMKNVANTNLLYWGSTLLALWEGGLPHELNPKTLETNSEGEYKFNGLFQNGDAVTAHPRIDSRRDRLAIFSAKQKSTKEVSIRLFEFDRKFLPTGGRNFSIPGTCICVRACRYSYLPVL